MWKLQYPCRSFKFFELIASLFPLLTSLTRPRGLEHFPIEHISRRLSLFLPPICSLEVFSNLVGLVFSDEGQLNSLL